jgi:hypothetical protein
MREYEEGKGFKAGDRVMKNPETWLPNTFDAWGRGEGVGVVVEPPFPIEDLDLVDVLWPAGRCMDPIEGLRLASDDHSTDLAG